jgi:hypothetical protein
MSKRRKNDALESMIYCYLFPSGLITKKYSDGQAKTTTLRHNGTLSVSCAFYATNVIKAKRRIRECEKTPTTGWSDR